MAILHEGLSLNGARREESIPSPPLVAGGGSTPFSPLSHGQDAPSIRIPATKTTPEVLFDSARDFLSLRGESYPENVVAFYYPILERLKDHWRKPQGRRIRVEIALTYFNSSSTKVLFTLFDLLNTAVQQGAEVDVYWYVTAGDDNMLEFGEDFRADCPHLRFHIEEVTP